MLPSFIIIVLLKTIVGTQDHSGVYNIEIMILYRQVIENSIIFT